MSDENASALKIPALDFFNEADRFYELRHYGCLNTAQGLRTHRGIIH